MKFNIPEHKLPASMKARRAVLSAKTGRSGEQAVAIEDSDSRLSGVGLPKYSELLAAIQELLAASSHLQPIHAFGGDGTVQGIRRAGKYLAAVERATAVADRAAVPPKANAPD